MKRRYFLKASVLSSASFLLANSGIVNAGKLVLKSSVGSSVAELMRSARVEFYKGNFVQAEQLYKTIIASSAGYVPAYDRLVSVYNRQSRFGDVVKLLRHAFNQDQLSPFFADRLARSLATLAFNCQSNKRIQESYDHAQLCVESLNIYVSAITDNPDAVFLRSGLSGIVSALEKNRRKNPAAWRDIPSDVVEKAVSLTVARETEAVRKSPVPLRDQVSHINRKKRVPLYNDKKQAERDNDILKSKKQLYRSYIKGANSANQSVKSLYVDLYKSDKQDPGTYGALKSVLKKEKDLRTLISVSKARYESLNTKWSKIGYSKDLVFGYLKTKNGSYLNEALSLLANISVGNEDGPDLCVAHAVIRAKALSFKRDFTQARSILIEVFRTNSAAVLDEYLTNALYIAYSKTYYYAGDIPRAKEVLLPLVEGGEGKGDLRDFFPKSAGKDIPVNVPVLTAQAKLYLKDGQKDKARKVCVRILAVSPRNYFAKRNSGI